MNQSVFEDGGVNSKVFHEGQCKISIRIEEVNKIFDGMESDGTVLQGLGNFGVGFIVEDIKKPRTLAAIDDAGGQFLCQTRWVPGKP